MSEPKRPDDDGPTADTGGSARAEYDWSVLAPSTAVVETVARAAGRDPTELGPLYGAVDPDALDALVRSMGTSSTADATVTFALEGHRICVRGDGSVVVRPDDARPDST